MFIIPCVGENKHNKKFKNLKINLKATAVITKHYFGANAFYGLITQPTYNHIRPHTSALNLMQSYFCEKKLLTFLKWFMFLKFYWCKKITLFVICIFLVLFASNSNKVMHLKIFHFIIVISSSDSSTSMTSFLILFIFFVSSIVGRIVLLLLLLFGTCQFQEFFLIILIAKNWT